MRPDCPGTRPSGQSDKVQHQHFLRLEFDLWLIQISRCQAFDLRTPWAASTRQSIGLSLEIDPRCPAQYRRRRPIRAAISGDTGTLPFTIPDADASDSLPGRQPFV